ncbi:TRADD-N-associated membrane domain-containing protein [Streptomyces arboris]|uniref:TRADD-N-associated membrane domain-containing protein n=1 Tax=Streptomyces arboris TaxID=2600619 RepID=UPI003C2EF2F4
MGFGIGGEAVALAAAAIISTVSTYFTGWRERGLKDETQQEADRLESAIFDESSDESEPQGSPTRKAEHSQQRFAKLLVQYYAHGLVQARRSFSISLTYSALGGLILMTGVALAIFRAETTGDMYASITASVSGLLISGVSILFHRRADAALQHLEKQGEKLQQDMKAERDAGQAVRLLDDVTDGALKAHLQAALILKFSAAQLPELNGALKSAEPLPEPRVNGALPHRQPESATS